MKTTICYHFQTLIYLIAIVNLVGGDLKLNAIYEWTYINYTWASVQEYDYAFGSGAYVPANNLPTCIKFYKERLFVALGRFFKGTPVTLASLYAYPNAKEKKDALLSPYPSWDMNDKRYCSSLQNVYTFDIDADGIMWVVDGVRFNRLSECPAKLVLINNKDTGSIKLTYEFPEHITKDSYLTDIVVDQGEYAYISDSSPTDPGLIVYSRTKNRSWKLRDASMFPDLKSAKFKLRDSSVRYYSGIKNIAVTPPKDHEQNYVFYSPVTGLEIYKINTKILQDEVFVRDNSWRKSITKAGKKSDNSAAFIIDNDRNLFFGLLNEKCLAKWAVSKSFSTATIISKHKDLKWVDSFSFDKTGRLYALCNNFVSSLTERRTINKDVRFRIFKVGKNKNKHKKY